jgi:hypothetical protein
MLNYPRRLTTAVPILALTVLAGCFHLRSLTSETRIEGGQSFVLGGNQRGSFDIVAKNSGGVPIVLYVQRGDQRDSVTTLAPGESADGAFPDGAAAVVRNTSATQTALVRLVVRGATNLSMGYR